MKFARKPHHRAKVPKESRKIRFIKKVGRYTYLILNNPSIQAVLKLLVQASVQLLLWLNRRFGIAYKIKAIVIQCFKVLISMDEDDQIRFYISSIGQQLIKIVFESALSMTQELQ